MIPKGLTICTVSRPLRAGAAWVEPRRRGGAEEAKKVTGDWRWERK
jgi:hypothetical protein